MLRDTETVFDSYKEYGIKILYFADENYVKGHRYDVFTDINELMTKIGV